MFFVIKVLERVKHSFNDIPDFQTLGHLDLDFATGDFLFVLLLKSPCLETLVIKVCEINDLNVSQNLLIDYLLTFNILFLLVFSFAEEIIISMSLF